MSSARQSRAQKDSFFILDKVIVNVFRQGEGKDDDVETRAKNKKIANRTSVVVLSECLDKLSILCIITQESIDPQWLAPVTYKTLEQKMTAKEDGYDLFTYTTKKKLAKDLTYLTKLLNEAIDDVIYAGDIGRLTKSLEIYRQETADAEDLLHECASSKVLLRKLSYDMRKSSSRNRDAFDKKADEAYRMHEKYEEIVGYGNAQYKYVDRWESNRTYLNDYINTQAENNYLNTVATYTTKQEMENRINKEIADYINVTMSDMQQEIELWAARYDDDVDRLEKEQFELKVATEKMEMDFASLTKEYAERQTDMEEWLKLREELRKEQEEERRQQEAATKIQAWWRGTMVRKHLGPYRKKGRGKGKGKGKGKDKKGAKGDKKKK